MKKLTLAVLALAAAATASAQVDLVKSAERMVKDGAEASAVVEAITPAFTNDETAGMALTWFVPGKASYAEYDKLVGVKALGQLPEDGNKKMGHLLIDGFNYFVKALPLDSLPDAKGKVKPKYSKDIVSIVTGHAVDYTNMGAELFNDRDYEGAYEAWKIFTTLPTMPAIASKLPQYPDSIYGEIYYNTGLAAWQANRLDDALVAFLGAKDHSYKKKNLYDYAIAVASQAGKNDTLLALAEEALPLYGAEDDMYLAQVVNYYLQAKDFTKAFDIINNALGTKPDNSQYYVIRGVLYENNEEKDKAIADYQKAMELDANNAKALWNYGRLLCEKAYRAADGAPTVEAQYIPYAEQNIYPLFREAAEILERAYSIDQDNPDNRDILNYLENVYYNLNEEAKLNDVKQRKAYL